jgi:hypothetical protein
MRHSLESAGQSVATNLCLDFGAPENVNALLCLGLPAMAQ